MVWVCQVCQSENKENLLLKKRNGNCVKCNSPKGTISATKQAEPEVVVQEEEQVEVECDCKDCEHFKIIVAYLGAVIENQRVLSEYVGAVSRQVDLLLPKEEEPEPTSEEIRVAALELRRGKKKVVV